MFPHGWPSPVRKKFYSPHSSLFFFFKAHLAMPSTPSSQRSNLSKVQSGLMAGRSASTLQASATPRRNRRREDVDNHRADGNRVELRPEEGRHPASGKRPAQVIDLELERRIRTRRTLNLVCWLATLHHNIYGMILIGNIGSSQRMALVPQWQRRSILRGMAFVTTTISAWFAYCYFSIDL